MPKLAPLPLFSHIYYPIPSIHFRTAQNKLSNLNCILSNQNSTSNKKLPPQKKITSPRKIPFSTIRHWTLRDNVVYWTIIMKLMAQKIERHHIFITFMKAIS